MTDAKSQSFEWFRNLAIALEGLSSPVVAIDSSGTIEWVNSAATKMFGDPPDGGTMAGRPITTLMPAEVGAQHQSYIDRYLKNRSNAVIVGKGGRGVTAVSFSGEQIPVHISVGEVGVSGHFIGLMVDLRELRAAQEAEHLANMELAAAKEVQLTKFLASMSHELRTPLNGILGMVDHIIESAVLPHQLDSLETIQESGKLLLNIVNDILDYSASSLGEMRLVSEVVDLHAILETCRDLVRRQATAKGLNLLFDVSPRVPTWVLLDAHRFEQVITNLLWNAVKFTSAGMVSLSAAYTDDSDPMPLTIKVADTGPGLPKNTDHLFEAFSQVSPGSGGVGLGLSISSLIIKAMGGVLDASNTPSGALFTVSLPIEATGPPNHGREFESFHMSNASVLVLDDHQSNRTIASRIIADSGGKCLPVASVRDARAFVTNPEIHIDVALVDVSIDGNDCAGLEFACWAKSLRPDLPIVAWSSVSLSKLDPVLASAISHWLVKPIKRKVLKKALSRALANGPGSPLTDGEREGNLTPLKVLIVEDNPVNMTVLRHFLTALTTKIDITEALDGRSAIQKISAESFDGIFLDIHLPDMSGLEVLTQIPQQSGFIVATTASVLAQQRQFYLTQGVNAILSKPLDRRSVAETLRAMNEARYAPSAPTTLGSDPSPLLDESRGLELAGGDSKLYHHVLRQVCRQLLDADVESPFEAPNPTGLSQLRELGHQLAGSAAQASLPRVVEACQAIESASSWTDMEVACKDFRGAVAELPSNPVVSRVLL